MVIFDVIMTSVRTSKYYVKMTSSFVGPAETDKQEVPTDNAIVLGILTLS